MSLDTLNETRLPLTHADLRAMAVHPSQPGAYDSSPLGLAAGLHVHTPGGPVHVVVEPYGKIAEVSASGTRFLYPRRMLTGEALAVHDRLPGHEGN